MSRMSLNCKLWFVFVLVWIGFLGVGVWSVYEMCVMMFVECKVGIVNFVDLVVGIVKVYYVFV